jgi:cytochrome c2
MPSTSTTLSGVAFALALTSVSTFADETNDAAVETEEPIVETSETVDDTDAPVESETEIAAITGDVKKGKKVFKKCKACHKVKAGKNGAGPTLYKVIGRGAASVEGFKYSSAMQEAGLVWDVETLTTYLKKPKELVPRTTMVFAGLKKDKDIENVIAYLDDVSKDE